MKNGRPFLYDRSVRSTSLRPPALLLAMTMTACGGAGAPGGVGVDERALGTPIDLHASPSGSGAACTEAAPCSLEGARQRVRALNANMDADIRVHLLDGTYMLATPFVLTESATEHDSGTNGYNVIY